MYGKRMHPETEGFYAEQEEELGESIGDPLVIFKVLENADVTIKVLTAEMIGQCMRGDQISPVFIEDFKHHAAKLLKEKRMRETQL